MYIDSRVWKPGPGDGDGEGDQPRRRRAQDVPWRAIGWTLVILWLIAASLVTSSGPLAAVLAYVGVMIGAWRGLRWMSSAGGLHDHKQ